MDRTKLARTAIKRSARPRADKLPLKFRTRNLYELKLSKAELSQLVERHAHHINCDQAYDLILEAFDRATLGLLFTMDSRYGPTVGERKLLAEQIVQLSRRLILVLTGELKSSSLTLGTVQYEMFVVARQLQAATKALPAVAALESAASEILKLDSRTLGGVAASASAKRGRPFDYALDILFRELMLAWEKLTGTKPALTMDQDNEATTCPFCLFFHTYFGGNVFTGRAIVERCRKLTPAIDIPMDQEISAALHARYNVKH